MNIEDAIRRLQDARGDKERQALATLEIVLDSQQTALRSALEAAAIPHWFNAAILGALLEIHEAQADEWVQALRQLPMVESFAARGGWNVHETTRLALRNQLYRTEQERFVGLAGRVAGCFRENAPAFLVETLYHRLLAAPLEAAGELEGTWREWTEAGRHEQLQALGMALDELIRADQLERPALARSLLCFVSIRQGRLPVAIAASLTRQSLDLFQELGDEAGQADAHSQLGDILQAAGNLASALREYSIHRELAGQLAARYPQEPRWQRSLADAHSKVGNVLETQDQLPQAMQEYEADKEILTHLTQRFPDNPIWQRDLAISHNFVGSVSEAQERLDDALIEYRAYQRIMLRLAGSDTVNIDWQRELSVACNCVGNIHRKQGRLSEALVEFENSRKILLGLTQRDPDSAARQYELALLHNCVGHVLKEQAQMEQALQEFAEARQILQALTPLDPDNTDWQRELSVVHNSAGTVLRAVGKPREALAEFEADLTIAESLAALDPTNAQWQKDVKTTRSSVARLRQQLEPISGGP